ncbi:glycosyltransferase [Desulfonema ishimotonii]|nr:glycosyltransferase [Desulfonema ishimotonii]
MPVYCRTFSAENIRGIRRALLSVLGQPCQIPVEITVVDDGSRFPISEQPALKDLFRDSRVRSVRLKQNSGIVFALNTGLQAVRYDLIARIDSDDAWRPGKLATQLRRMADDPDLTIVGTGMRLIHSDRRRDEELIRPESWSGLVRFAAQVGCPFPHGSILARRSVFELLGGYSHDAAVTHCEDYAMWIRWLRFFKGATIPEVFYEYTVSETAVSGLCARSQQLAAETLRHAFLRLNSGEKIPEHMDRIARALDVPLTEAGKYCFLAWRFYSVILAEAPLYDALKVILPDRHVVPADKTAAIPHERILWFSNDAFPRHLAADPVHTLETLQDFQEV